MTLKIHAFEIQPGDEINAYCNNKMQVCRVKNILEKDSWNISLMVSAAGVSRASKSIVIKFRLDAVVEIHTKI